MTVSLLPSGDGKPSPSTEDINVSEVVESVVSDIVDSVGNLTALEAEKQAVQSLINDLVQRVQNGEGEASGDNGSVSKTANQELEKGNTTVQNATNATVNKTKKVNIGVPFGDHRLRRIGKSEVMWTQTIDAVTINVQVPKWVGKRQVKVSFTTGGLEFKVEREGKMWLERKESLWAGIDVDGSTWAVETMGGKKWLTIELEKLVQKWWGRVFMGDNVEEYEVIEDYKQVGDIGLDDDEEGGIKEPTSEEEWERMGKEVREAEKVEKEEDSIEKAVKETLEDVIDKAVVGAEKKVERTGQRVFSRQDMMAVVEKYKATMEKGGEGAASAAMQLATFYHHGIGVEKSDTQAANLYKYALENGVRDALAAFQLGLIYNSGTDEIAVNNEEAVKWWQVSAGLGNSVAMFNLGVMKMNGSGCDMDPVEASVWFARAQALNRNLRPPRFTRAQMMERMKTAERLKKEKEKLGRSPEERRERRERAMERLWKAGLVTGGVVGVLGTMVVIRNWMRNRL